MMLLTKKQSHEAEKGRASHKELTQKRIKTLMPLLGLVFIVIFFAISTKGKSIALANMKTVFNQAFVNLIGACGLFFVISQGKLDFSTGSILGLSGVVSVIAVNTTGNLLVGILAALATGALCGALNGMCLVLFKAPANIVTLATQYALRGLVIVITSSTSLMLPIKYYKFDDWFVKLPVMLIMIVIMYVIYEYTKLGKYFKSVGAGGQTAVQSGVNVPKMNFLAFLLSGLVAGLCGFFALLRAGSVASITGETFATDCLLALVIGGMPLSGGAYSKIRFAVIGSVMLAVLTNGLIIWGINENTMQLFKGIIFLAAVAISFEQRNDNVSI